LVPLYFAASWPIMHDWLSNSSISVSRFVISSDTVFLMIIVELHFQDSLLLQQSINHGGLCLPANHSTVISVCSEAAEEVSTRHLVRWNQIAISGFFQDWAIVPFCLRWSHLSNAK
jgi:hypothetical protein